MGNETTNDWKAIIDSFVARNERRPTRLGVFVEEERGTQDFWIEDGLPLDSITVESGADKLNVEMIFGSRESGGSGMTHRVSDVRRLNIVLGKSKKEDVIEFRDGEGKNTVLRFEDIDVL